MRRIYVDEESPIESIIKPFGLHFDGKRKANGNIGAEMCKEIAQSNKPKVEDVRILCLNQDPSLYINCTMSKECFDVLLSLYKNNHSYYILNLDKTALVNLESWFIQVIEPPPRGNTSDIEEWNNREAWKLKGYTWYCNYKDKNKLRICGKVMAQVRINYANLKPWRLR